MSNESDEGTKVPGMATPERMAEDAIKQLEGEDAVIFVWKSGLQIARVPFSRVATQGGELDTLRLWLAGWIEDSYEAGRKQGLEDARVLVGNYLARRTERRDAAAAAAEDAYKSAVKFTNDARGFDNEVKALREALDLLGPEEPT